MLPSFSFNFLFLFCCRAWQSPLQHTGLPCAPYIEAWQATFAFRLPDSVSIYTAVHAYRFFTDGLQHVRVGVFRSCTHGLVWRFQSPWPYVSLQETCLQQQLQSAARLAAVWQHNTTPPNETYAQRA